MKNLTRYILSRSRERSTWIGMITVLTATGMALTSEQTEAIASAGMAMAGLVAVFTKDPGSKK